MKNLVHFVCLCIISFSALNISAQDALQLNLHIGFGVPTASDYTFKEVVFWPGGTKATSSGNIGPSNTISPTVRLGLTKAISNRWKTSLYVEYLFNNGELFKTKRLGVHNGQSFALSFPSKRKLHWFNVGALAFYELKKTKKTSFAIGTGLTVLFSKHYYRNELIATLDENIDIINTTETFVTIEKTLMELPFYLEYNYNINEQLGLIFGIKASVSIEENYNNLGAFVGINFDLK